MSPPLDVSRRSFLRSSSVVGAAAAWTATSYANIVGANDRIRVGFIGAGGMASGHMNAIAALKDSNNLESLAVADCWKTRADAGAEKVGAPNAFADYRRLAYHGSRTMVDKEVFT